MKKITVIFDQYKSCIDTIWQNSFDDDLILEALQGLQQIWSKNTIARSFVLVDYGSVSLVLNLAASENKRVVLKTVEALLALLKGDECTDMLVKFGAIQILKECSLSKSLDIKKISL